MVKLLSKLRNIVRVGKITGPANNSDQFPVQQLTFKGKVADTLMVFPFGVYANVSTEDALALFFSIDGNEENRAAIAYTPQKRPTDLANGEIAVYHPATASFIKFRNTGDIEIESTADVNLEGANVNITAATKVNIDSPATDIGVGGAAIARVGDATSVTIPGGSSAGTYAGTITSGGANTSI